jgi:hypothetical protein
MCFTAYGALNLYWTYVDNNYNHFDSSKLFEINRKHDFVLFAIEDYLQL